MTFYSYLYIDENGLPYYAGKGCRDRAYRYHGFVPVPLRDRIKIFPMLNEKEAFESEIAMIELFGRKCYGGILLNVEPGGRAPSRATCSKGGRKNAEGRFQDHEYQSRAGHFGGLAAGKKFSGDGGMDAIRSMEASREGGITQGRNNAESGHCARIANLGGKAKLGIPSPGSGNKCIPREQQIRGLHSRWHVARGIVKEGCQLCMNA